MSFLQKILGKSKAKIWEVGDKIKAFQMTTHTGSEFTYNAKTRSKLLIFFFPNSWSDTNKEQILLLEKNYTRFVRFNLIPLCITTDTTASIKKWAKTMSIKDIRILSDFWPHGFLTNSFALLNRQRGCPERALVMIDDDMTVLMKRRLEHTNSFEVEEIFEFIKNRNSEKENQ